MELIAGIGCLCVSVWLKEGWGRGEGLYDYDV
jgi:hypothetical protein